MIDASKQKARPQNRDGLFLTRPSWILGGRDTGAEGHEGHGQPNQPALENIFPISEKPIDSISVIGYIQLVGTNDKKRNEDNGIPKKETRSATGYRPQAQ